MGDLMQIDTRDKMEVFKVRLTILIKYCGVQDMYIGETKKPVKIFHEEKTLKFLGSKP